MHAIVFDEHGFAVGLREPPARAAAYTLFSPAASSRLDHAGVTAHVERFFGARLTLSPDKTYPGGAEPVVDAMFCELEGGPVVGPSPTERVLVVTFPLARAHALSVAAEEAVRAMGDQGMGAVLARARRVWSVCAPTRGEAGEREDAASQAAASPGAQDDALVVAAMLASALLAPILPPHEERLLGPKSARERLARRR
jgi:hypothetical protein